MVPSNMLFPLTLNLSYFRISGFAWRKLRLYASYCRAVYVDGLYTYSDFRYLYCGGSQKCWEPLLSSGLERGRSSVFFCRSVEIMLSY